MNHQSHQKETQHLLWASHSLHDGSSCTKRAFKSASGHLYLECSSVCAFALKANDNVARWFHLGELQVPACLRELFGVVVSEVDLQPSPPCVLI